MKKLIAETSNGFTKNDTKEINSLCFWKNRTCKQELNYDNLNELLSLAKKSERITYDPSGSIDPFAEIPLYTNGQANVVHLYLDNVEIY